MPNAKQSCLLLGIKKILYSATKFQNDALCEKPTKTPLGIVALPTSKFGIITGMSQQTLDKIDYIVACVNEFADAHGLDYVNGFDYLKRHAGIAFLDRNYAVEHTYPMEDTISDLSAVCRRNGGGLK